MRLNNISAIFCVLLLGFFSEVNAAYQRGHDSVWEKTGQKYSECINKAEGVHPEVISCIRGEISRQDKIIENKTADAAKNLLTADLISSINQSKRAWKKYVRESCGLYSELGGQRSELLIENCVLKEVMWRGVFIDDLISEADL
jgi:uncharacterized protein YecT (DUF1311 family)